MRSRHTILALALAALLPAATARAVSNFNFDSDVVGTATTFSDTSNGLTATFSSTTGVFNVVSNLITGGGFSGKILVDDGLTNAHIPLIITFSQSVHTFDFLFATDDSGSPSTLHIDAYLSASLQGSFDDVGSPVSGSFPQGTSGHNPGFSFDKLVLSDADAPAFAIDSLTVIPDAVPVAPLPSSAASGLGLFSALAVIAAGKRFPRPAIPTA